MILDKIIESKRKVLEISKIECNIRLLEDIVNKQPEALNFKDVLKKQSLNDIKIIADEYKGSIDRLAKYYPIQSYTIGGKNELYDYLNTMKIHVDKINERLEKKSSLMNLAQIRKKTC